MENKKTLVTGIVIILIIVVYFFMGENINNKENLETREDNIIKIGVVSPLTGDVAFFGEGQKRTLELAVKDFIGEKYQYEIIFEDDALDPKKAINAAQKLIQVDNVDFLISLSSGIGNVISPIADTNKVIHFAMASDKNIANGDLNFIHWTPPEEEARVMVEELENGGYEKLAILGLNHQGWLAINNELKAGLNEEKIEIVFEEKFNPGTNDFKTLITKAKETNPDIYLLGAFSPELEILVNQMNELEVNTEITSIESFAVSEELSLFEGSWYVDAAVPNEEYLEKYNNTFSDNYAYGGPNTYDIYGLIVKISEKMEKFNREKWAKNLEKEIVSYDSVFGNLTMNEKGIISSKAAVMKIENGNPVVIKK